MCGSSTVSQNFLRFPPSWISLEKKIPPGAKHPLGLPRDLRDVSVGGNHVTRVAALLGDFHHFRKSFPISPLFDDVDTDFPIYHIPRIPFVGVVRDFWPLPQPSPLTTDDDDESIYFKNTIKLQQSWCGHVQITVQNKLQ